VTLGQHDVVARLLGQSFEVADKNPGEWMKPEDGAIAVRNPLDQRVAAASVGLFVRESHAAKRLRPIAGRVRQQLVSAARVRW
jgi:hypothetical protein